MTPPRRAFAWWTFSGAVTRNFCDQFSSVTKPPQHVATTAMMMMLMMMGRNHEKAVDSIDAQAVIEDDNVPNENRAAGIKASETKKSACRLGMNDLLVAPDNASHHGSHRGSARLKALTLHNLDTDHVTIRCFWNIVVGTCSQDTPTGV